MGVVVVVSSLAKVFGLVGSDVAGEVAARGRELHVSSAGCMSAVALSCSISLGVRSGTRAVEKGARLYKAGLGAGRGGGGGMERVGHGARVGDGVRASPGKELG